MRWQNLFLVFLFSACLESSSDAENLLDWEAYQSRQHWLDWSEQPAAGVDATKAGTSVQAVLDWLQARDRISAEMQKAEQSISEAALLESAEAICTDTVRADIETSVGGKKCDAVITIYFDTQCNASEARQYDLARYLSDMSLANEHGLSIELFLTQRIAQRRACAAIDRARYEEERQEAQRLEKIKTILLLIVIVSFTTLCFLARRKIGHFFLSWWQRKSFSFRVWVFGTIFWILGVLILVGLLDPYGEGYWNFVSNDDALHLVTVLTIPPAFLGVFWVCYKRFLKRG